VLVHIERRLAEGLVVLAGLLADELDAERLLAGLQRRLRNELLFVADA